VKYRNGVASLSSGQIAYFKIGLHKGRKAFRQASTFLVDRDGVGRGLSAPVSCALNWHDAPGYTTSSLGCQTNPKDVFPAVRELGYHLINKYYPKKQIIPYILVDGPRAFALAEQHQSAKEGGKSRPVCQAAIDIVKKSEGLRLKPYLCPAGKWTIGYGHTKNVTAETKEITTEIAEHLLAEDLAEFGNGVTKLLEVVTNDNEFGALVSLAYNIGLGNLANSTLLKELNLKNFDKAADQFLVWNKARNPKTKKLEVLAGLTKRRALERNLFLS
jgi:lysozyme